MGKGGLGVAFAAGLFTVILKYPERAREMGLLGAKAELAMGTADWPTFFYALIHSYGLVLLTFIAGLAATLTWWRSADRAR